MIFAYALGLRHSDFDRVVILRHYDPQIFRNSGPSQRASASRLGGTTRDLHVRVTLRTLDSVSRVVWTSPDWTD